MCVVCVYSRVAGELRVRSLPRVFLSKTLFRRTFLTLELLKYEAARRFGRKALRAEGMLTGKRRTAGC